MAKKESTEPSLEKIEEESLPGKVSIKWKETTIVVILVVLIALLVVYIVAGKKGQEQAEQAVTAAPVGQGDPAPEFSLPTTEGKTVNLSDQRGKVVLVHFWATWCPSCVEEMPVLERLSKAVAGKDLSVLAVSVDEGGAGAVTAFMKRNNLGLPVLLDQTHAVSARYGTFKLPETYVVDRAGVVRYKVVGPMDWMAPQNRAVLQQLIKGR